MAVCSALISSLFLGLGMAELRILTRFKEIRTKDNKQNYFFLKPLFWTLLLAQMIVPAFMYPSLALQGQQSHNYSGKKMLFFIISALIVSLMLCAIGIALEHAKLTTASFNLCLTVVTPLVMLLIDFLMINQAGQRIEAGHLKNSLMVYFGFWLLVVPQCISNLYKVCTESPAKKKIDYDNLNYGMPGGENIYD